MYMSCQKNKSVTWSSLPNKRQLAVLTLLKISEGMSRRSYSAFLFHQLKWFDPSLPDSTISSQAGIIQGSSTAIQIFSATLLGRLADTALIGRKNTLMIGLIGFAISSIGLAFSRNFITAAISLAVGGAVNGNAGLIRTILAETLTEKKYQSRAFLLLPLSGTIGAMVGPVIGGGLADPVQTYPSLFGPDSLLGGKDGVKWMIHWPYALPNLVSALVCLCATAISILGLDETHEAARHRIDWGRRAGKAIVRRLCARRSRYKYQPLSEHTSSIDPAEEGAAADEARPANLEAASTSGKSLLQMPNVLLTLVSRFLFIFHIQTNNAMLLIFYPTPRSPSSGHHAGQSGGGLGLPSAQVGVAMAIAGAVYLPLSFAIYPRVSSRMGTLQMYHAFLPLVIIMYGLTPLLVFIPDQPSLLWAGITALNVIEAIFNTFAFPSSVILLNNTVSDPKQLATVHGLGQSVNSAATAIGPLIGGWALGLAFKYNQVGCVWWGLIVVVVIQWVVGLSLKPVD
ncbi:major facilitator superfamily domain-containing protein [Aspergillus ambiguus]|uniref:putative MFS multidrug transporter n=1 Tax=Aspergillus ambiguus TaxID=176160 RepID=UPI003CCE02DE